MSNHSVLSVLSALGLKRDKTPEESAGDQRQPDAETIPGPELSHPEQAYAAAIEQEPPQDSVTLTPPMAVPQTLDEATAQRRAEIMAAIEHLKGRQLQIHWADTGSVTFKRGDLAESIHPSANLHTIVRTANRIAGVPLLTGLVK